MQSHQVEHSNLPDDINTARELMASLEWAWIPWEKGKERAERREQKEQTMHSIYIWGLLSTEQENRSCLHCLCGVLRQIHGVTYEELRDKNQLGQGHPGFHAKGSAHQFVSMNIIYLPIFPSQAHR